MRALGKLLFAYLELDELQCYLATHSFVAGFRYPERNRRGPLVINPLLPNRESPVSDLASRPALNDGEKTCFPPRHIVLRSLNAAAQALLEWSRLG